MMTDDREVAIGKSTQFLRSCENVLTRIAAAVSCVPSCRLVTVDIRSAIHLVRLTADSGVLESVGTPPRGAAIRSDRRTTHHESPSVHRLPEPPAVPPPTNFRVARVLSFLDEYFADLTICLPSAAHYVDVTPSHLDRLLKEHTGLTFLQHLRRIRMRHAERLLLTTTSSIKETAYACGYARTARFGRDFKRTHGCPASVWRALGTLGEAPGNTAVTKNVFRDPQR